MRAHTHASTYAHAHALSLFRVRVCVCVCNRLLCSLILPLAPCLPLRHLGWRLQHTLPKQTRVTFHTHVCTRMNAHAFSFQAHQILQCLLSFNAFNRLFVHIVFGSRLNPEREMMGCQTLCADCILLYTTCLLQCLKNCFSSVIKL